MAPNVLDAPSAMAWIERETAESPLPEQANDLCLYLKDGRVLCLLANALANSQVIKVRPLEKHRTFHALESVSLFLRWVRDDAKVNELFSSAQLLDEKDEKAVLKTLSVLYQKYRNGTEIPIQSPKAGAKPNPEHEKTTSRVSKLTSMFGKKSASTSEDEDKKSTFSSTGSKRGSRLSSFLNAISHKTTTPHKEAPAKEVRTSVVSEPSTTASETPTPNDNRPSSTATPLTESPERVQRTPSKLSAYLLAVGSPNPESNPKSPEPVHKSTEAPATLRSSSSITPIAEEVKAPEEPKVVAEPVNAPEELKPVSKLSSFLTQTPPPPPSAITPLKAPAPTTVVAEPVEVEEAIALSGFTEKVQLRSTPKPEPEQLEPVSPFHRKLRTTGKLAAYMTAHHGSGSDDGLSAEESSIEPVAAVVEDAPSVPELEAPKANKLSAFITQTPAAPTNKFAAFMQAIPNAAPAIESKPETPEETLAEAPKPVVEEVKVEAPTAVEAPAPVEVPAPVVEAPVEPAPVDVTQPAPVVVAEPIPVDITESAPVDVTQPAPVVKKPKAVEAALAVETKVAEVENTPAPSSASRLTAFLSKTPSPSKLTAFLSKSDSNHLPESVPAVEVPAPQPKHTPEVHVDEPKSAPEVVEPAPEVVEPEPTAVADVTEANPVPVAEVVLPKEIPRGLPSISVPSKDTIAEVASVVVDSVIEDSVTTTVNHAVAETEVKPAEAHVATIVEDVKKSTEVAAVEAKQTVIKSTEVAHDNLVKTVEDSHTAVDSAIESSTPALEQVVHKVDTEVTKEPEVKHSAEAVVIKAAEKVAEVKSAVESVVVVEETKAPEPIVEKVEAIVTPEPKAEEPKPQEKVVEKAVAPTTPVALPKATTEPATRSSKLAAFFSKSPATNKLASFLHKSEPAPEATPRSLPAAAPVARSIPAPVKANPVVPEPVAVVETQSVVPVQVPTTPPTATPEDIVVSHPEVESHEPEVVELEPESRTEPLAVEEHLEVANPVNPESTSEYSEPEVEPAVPEPESCVEPRVEVAVESTAVKVQIAALQAQIAELQAAKVHLVRELTMAQECEAAARYSAQVAFAARDAVIDGPTYTKLNPPRVKNTVKTASVTLTNLEEFTFEYDDVHRKLVLLHSRHQLFPTRTLHSINGVVVPHESLEKSQAVIVDLQAPFVCVFQS
ncbi:hypothetical protein THRCLA_10315 [Thraustotheca clavata]|uniref:Calponin-homology (CH) domain-containing protein n=1 Tax=Thraustotheca clavata TaxID=74557 RepID=A0A1V9YS10_9STRA|nr:hypothetical protein THRCLA_10315 [Thraustotheca clavata]